MNRWTDRIWPELALSVNTSTAQPFTLYVTQQFYDKENCPLKYHTLSCLQLTTFVSQETGHHSNLNVMLISCRMKKKKPIHSGTHFEFAAVFRCPFCKLQLTLSSTESLLRQKFLSQYPMQRNNCNAINLFGYFGQKSSKFKHRASCNSEWTQPGRRTSFDSVE